MNYEEINEILKKYKSESAGFNQYGFFYTNKNGFGCNDMPGGFQRINPMLFIVIGDILGDVMAGNLPFNVQNSIGNWIQLVGQAIETYSSQQQYFQSGPGRYYSPENLNITNPLCPEVSKVQSGTSVSDEQAQNSSSKSNEDEVIVELLCTIKEIKEELTEVKKRVDAMGK